MMTFLNLFINSKNFQSLVSLGLGGGRMLEPPSRQKMHFLEDAIFYAETARELQTWFRQF